MQPTDVKRIRTASPVRRSRASVDEIKAQGTHIARDNPETACRVAQRLRATGDSLADFATGHPGRVAETYEKSVSSLPYVIAYAMDRTSATEVVVVLHVIHTARDWREGECGRGELRLRCPC